MNLRNLAMGGMIILGVLAVYAAISQGGAAMGTAKGGAAGKPDPITYSQLVAATDAGQIKSVEIHG